MGVATGTGSKAGATGVKPIKNVFYYKTNPKSGVKPRHFIGDIVNMIAGPAVATVRVCRLTVTFSQQSHLTAYSVVLNNGKTNKLTFARVESTTKSSHPRLRLTGYLMNTISSRR